MEGLSYPSKEAVARVRLASEERQQKELLADSAIGPIAEQMVKQAENDAQRRRLLASALRITDRISPALTGLVADAQQITHLGGAGVEMYVDSEPRQNAACMYSERGGLILIMTAGLIERLSERELLFVVGHEFGHAIYHHHDLPARGILERHAAPTAEAAMKLMAWSRRAELSADRVGLLCCQDLAAAAQALIKLACGLTERFIHFDLEAYVSQMNDIQAICETERDVQDCFATHPFNPLRVMTLDSFWHSQMLADLLGHGRARHSDREADEQVEKLLAFMEPEPPEVGAHRTAERLLWAGLLVATSDGSLEDKELENLTKMTEPDMAQEAIAAVRAAADPAALIRERFAAALGHGGQMPVSERHAFVQRLIAIAKSDQVVAEPEKEALREVCKALDIDPLFVDKILVLFGD